MMRILLYPPIPSSNTMAEELYDVIIIGAGPAGLTSGIYTSRHDYRTLILEGGKVGGKAAEAHLIENYPGFPDGVKGYDLMAHMEEQAKRFGAEIRQETVYGISDMGNLKMVTTRSGSVYEAKALIIATGVSRKSLNAKGENEFKGRGVSYCGICDGPFFKGKTVAVIGAGHEAVHDIQMLSEVAVKVYAIPGKGGYSEDYPELAQLQADTRIEFVYGEEVVEIGGSDFVEYIVLDGERGKVRVDGVFMILEHISVLGILADIGVETDMGGCVKVDVDQKTSVPGVFAAGDCCCRGFQIATAVGMGAAAALNAMRYVKELVTI